MSHPNRNAANRGIPPASPTPGQVHELRTLAGLTQLAAAKLIHRPLRTWQHWESPPGSPEARPMPADSWELFAIKVKALGVALPEYLARYFAEGE